MEVDQIQDWITNCIRRVMRPLSNLMKTAIMIAPEIEQDGKVISAMENASIPLQLDSNHGLSDPDSFCLTITVPLYSLHVNP